MITKRKVILEVSHNDITIKKEADGKIHLIKRDVEGGNFTVTRPQLDDLSAVIEEFRGTYDKEPNK
jgi:hypothetical protein